MSVKQPLGKVSITPKGAWSASTAYVFLDAVENNGSSYLAKKNVPAGTPLTDTSYWLTIAKKGDPGTTSWSGIVDKPTTIAGFGITDAVDDLTFAQYQQAVAEALEEKYVKPTGGIPKTDLATAVQTSLGLADSALQEHQSLAEYRKSADQDEIDEAQDDAINAKYTKPSGGIPDSDIASASTWNAKGTYSKPSGGIPKTDLASAVQTSLGLADSALQSVPSTYRTAADQDVIDNTKVDETDFEQYKQSVQAKFNELGLYRDADGDLCEE